VRRKKFHVKFLSSRALQSRDKGCRFPGCTLHCYVDGHHVRHWAEGGETKLSNLVLLCRFHHRLVHEGGFTVQIRDDGA
jgi:predicted restriction endonuclease